MAGGFLLMVAVASLIRGLDGFHWVWRGGLSSLASGFWLFLMVALREELFFRGYAFQRLLDGTSEWLALGLASLYFAYAHWNNPGMVGTLRIWASLNIAFVGVLLGLCYLKTRSLALPMGLHLGWNWTQGSLLGFGVSGLQTGSLLAPVFHERPLWLTGGAFGLEASLPCALLCGLAIAGLVLWHPREAA
jgi:membrane protease YdiL (CAAX protease family)